MTFFAARAHCWLPVSLLSCRTPRSFSAKLLSNQPAPSEYCCIALFLPRGRTSRFPLLNFQDSSLPSSLACQAPSEWQQTHLVYSHSSQVFLLSVNVLRKPCVPSSRQLITSILLPSITFLSFTCLEMFPELVPRPSQGLR